MGRVAFSLVFAFVFSLQAFAQSPDCSRQAGALPDPDRPVGAEDLSNPIRHIVVIMQENHSFDEYFGHLNGPEYYGSEVDGLSPDFVNRDSRGRPVHPFRETSLCPKDPDHSWNIAHEAWDGGRNDGFVRGNESYFGAGDAVMGTYGPEDLPYYYGLARRFAIADRYFSSTLSETFPNRFYLLTGTSFGHIRNDIGFRYTQRLIFELLNEHGISWGYYSDSFGFLKLFGPFYGRNLSHMKSIADFGKEARLGTLPQVVFMDSAYRVNDEHPSSSVQNGQYWVSLRLGELMSGPDWKSSVAFLSYDEDGGFFDHVPPPEACAPDGIPPMLRPGDVADQFDRYGFRVPFVAISPYVKAHYVSHRVYDHTSILRFIETKFNLPALTRRDANADPFGDLFDYAHPDFDVSGLPSALPDATRACGWMDTPDQ